MERHGQHCQQCCQEHFLPPRRKVCAGSGNTESFPERRAMSWQQRESPVSWEGLGVPPARPSLLVIPWHSIPQTMALLLLTRGLYAGPTLPSTPQP